MWDAYVPPDSEKRQLNNIILEQNKKINDLTSKLKALTDKLKKTNKIKKD